MNSAGNTATTLARGRWRKVAGVVLVAGLAVSGCGALDGLGDQDPGDGLQPAEDDDSDEAGNGEDSGGSPEPDQSLPAELPRFGVGESIEGPADEDPWEGVLVVEEQTFVAIDARGLDARADRALQLSDASGAVLAAVDNRGPAIDIGGRAGDPIAFVDLEPGEYLLRLPMLELPTREAVPADFQVQAFPIPQIEVGDSVDVSIRAYEEQQEALEPGQLFGLRLPADGTYAFETSSDQGLLTQVSLYRSPGQEWTDDWTSNETRGQLQEQLEAGSYTVMISNPDAESGSAVLRTAEQ